MMGRINKRLRRLRSAKENNLESILRVGKDLKWGRSSRRNVYRDLEIGRLQPKEAVG